MQIQLQILIIKHPEGEDYHNICKRGKQAECADHSYDQWKELLKLLPSTTLEIQACDLICPQLLLRCAPQVENTKKYLVRICFCVLKSEYEVETFCPFFWHACNLRVVGCLTNLIEFVFTIYSSVSHVTKSWHVFL